MTRVISIGVLTPHAASGPEVELPDMAPAQLVLEVSRISAPGASTAAPGTPPTSPAGLRALTAPAALDEAAAAFAAGSIEVIGHASTTTGYGIGFEAETALVDGLSQRWNLPVVGSSLAAVAALRALDIEHVALVHPHWFEDELHGLGAAYFRSQGFAVVASGPADLPNDPSRVDPGEIVDWVSGHVSDDAEAVFVGGTGFRAARAIEALELALSRPVVTSNQALLWAMFAAAHADFEVLGYGTLFGRHSQ